MINDLIQYINSNLYFTFFVSLTGLIGFFITVYLMFKTHNINKVLKRMETAKEYNKKRKDFASKFNGFRMSIIKDDVKSRTLASDLHIAVVEYKSQFASLLNRKDKGLIKNILKDLGVEYEKINWDILCKHLEILTGMLSKKETI